MARAKATKTSAAGSPMRAGSNAADKAVADKVGRPLEQVPMTKASLAKAAPAMTAPAKTAKSAKTAPPAPAVSPEAPQVGMRTTKVAQMIALLSQKDGCTLMEAANAVGWATHTTRAAMTRLRQKGHKVELVKGEAGQASRHRIVAAGQK